MTGFGRVIQYYKEDAENLFPYYIVEGQLYEGMPRGFVRIIEPSHSYIGYLKDMIYT